MRRRPDSTGSASVLYQGFHGPPRLLPRSATCNHVPPAILLSVFQDERALPRCERCCKKYWPRMIQATMAALKFAIGNFNKSCTRLKQASPRTGWSGLSAMLPMLPCRCTGSLKQGTPHMRSQSIDLPQSNKHPIWGSKEQEGVGLFRACGKGILFPGGLANESSYLFLLLIRWQCFVARVALGSGVWAPPRSLVMGSHGPRCLPAFSHP